VKTVFNRYGEQNEHLKRALAVGYRVFNGEALEPVDGDHPVYFEIKNDLGLERFQGPSDKGKGDTPGLHHPIKGQGDVQHHQGL